MHLKLKQTILKNHPEENKEDFIRKIEFSNYLRVKYFSAVLALIGLFMCLGAFFIDEMYIIKKVALMFLVFSVIGALLFKIRMPKGEELSVFNKLAIALEVLFVVFWFSTLSVLIPNRYEFLFTYSLVILSVSSLLFLRWQSSFVLFAFSAAYIAVFSTTDLSYQTLPQNTILLSLTIMAWLISRLLYKKELDNFIAEKELEKSNNILSENYVKLIEANNRIKSKTDQLAKTNELLRVSEQEAKISNHVKTDFLARMSHDMRTPLTSIIGLSEFGIEEHRDDKDVEYFTMVKDNSEYLLSLVNDTLDLQKLESCNLDLNYTIEECRSAKKKVLNIAQLEADTKGITLISKTENIERKEYIKTDEKRVEQILINILSNAFKYTPRGGHVTWENSLINISNEEMIIRNVIRDNGVGMSEEFLNYMYEPFSKEDNSLSKDESSTGLGLAICKNIIETMGGSIECESELGKGTKFTVDIPHKYATQEEIDQYLKEKDIIENIKFAYGKKALICEDSKINARILSKILKQVGIVSEHAKNGQEAIERAKANDYDIIFMDIRMPVMDGLTSTKKIREFNLDIPIIALSANAYIEDIKKSIEAGMNAHLAKPFNKEIIFKEIVKYL
ncbi:MAG: response regulator [Peptostreptococcaceae bacterium]|nr:response regulator [Peptostreptococcaceae bacterium]